MTRPRRIAVLAEQGSFRRGALRFPFARLMTTTLVREALEEDGAEQRHHRASRRSFPIGAARCRIVARRAGVIAGIPLAREAFRQRDPKRVGARRRVKDGQQVAPARR